MGWHPSPAKAGPYTRNWGRLSLQCLAPLMGIVSPSSRKKTKVEMKKGPSWYEEKWFHEEGGHQLVQVAQRGCAEAWGWSRRPFALIWPELSFDPRIQEGWAQGWDPESPALGYGVCLSTAHVTAGIGRTHRNTLGRCIIPRQSQNPRLNWMRYPHSVHIHGYGGISIYLHSFSRGAEQRERREIPSPHRCELC